MVLNLKSNLKNLFLWANSSTSIFLKQWAPGMSGVQGGLGEQKRDILEIREEAMGLGLPVGCLSWYPLYN